MINCVQQDNDEFGLAWYATWGGHVNDVIIVLEDEVRSSSVTLGSLWRIFPPPSFIRFNKSSFFGVGGLKDPRRKNVHPSNSRGNYTNNKFIFFTQCFQKQLALNLLNFYYYISRWNQRMKTFSLNSSSPAPWLHAPWLLRSFLLLLFLYFSKTLKPTDVNIHLQSTIFHDPLVNVANALWMSRSGGGFFEVVRKILGGCGGHAPADNFKIQSLWNHISCILGRDFREFSRL